MNAALAVAQMHERAAAPDLIDFDHHHAITWRAGMTRIKFIELRDRNTFIPAVAIDCSLSGAVMVTICCAAPGTVTPAASCSLRCMDAARRTATPTTGVTARGRRRTSTSSSTGTRSLTRRSSTCSSFGETTEKKISERHGQVVDEVRATPVIVGRSRRGGRCGALNTCTGADAVPTVGALGCAAARGSGGASLR